MIRLSFSSRAVSIRIGTARCGANAAGEIEAAFARHHHVEDEKIELQAGELGAGIERGFRRRDAVAFAQQKARQQRADAAIVVDDEKVRRIVGRILRRTMCRIRSLVRAGGRHRSSSRVASALLLDQRVGMRDQAQHMIAVLGVDHAGEETPRRLARAGAEFGQHARKCARSAARRASWPAPRRPG